MFGVPCIKRLCGSVKTTHSSLQIQCTQVSQPSALPLKWSAPLPLPSRSNSITWQWPHPYMCLMKLSLASRDLLPLQHDPSTEKGPARWRLYHWVTWSLIKRSTHCGALLSFAAPASLSSHLPFSFSFPGLFMGFFCFYIGSWSSRLLWV